MKARRPEPAEIEYKNMRFLITDRPTDSTLDKYIEVCREWDDGIDNDNYDNINNDDNNNDKIRGSLSFGL